MSRNVDLQWLFEQAHPVPFSGCWLWTKSLQGSGGGYARIMTGGRVQSAHRVAYELKYGPIPAGLEMDHLCRVRCCVNPDHVEPVTTRINQLRGNAPAVVAARNRSPEMREVVSRPKSPSHRANLKAMLTARNQSAEMRAIVSKPKTPEHREAMRQAQLARNRK